MVRERPPRHANRGVSRETSQLEGAETEQNDEADSADFIAQAHVAAAAILRRTSSGFLLVFNLWETAVATDLTTDEQIDARAMRDAVVDGLDRLVTFIEG